MNGNMTDRQIDLPYFELSEQEYSALFMADEDQRYRLLDKLMKNKPEGPQMEDIPPVWRTGPLGAWCWYVLEINGLEPDPNEKTSLVHYGIDLGFCSQELRRWIGTMA